MRTQKTSTAAIEEPLCGGCTKPIHFGEERARILMDKVKKGSYVEKQWAILHRSCFNRSVDSPTAAYEEMQRVARQTR